MLNVKDIYAVILAGGAGERFWPMSTTSRPKQFLAIPSGKPLICEAVERIEALIPLQNVFIITRADLVGMVHKVLPDFPRKNIVGEPCGRDTAAAVALGAALVKSRNEKAAFCVLTSDHLIGRRKVFLRTLSDCFKLALSSDSLITIGIKPSTPSTGFGYIEVGGKLNDAHRFCHSERSEESLPQLSTWRRSVRCAQDDNVCSASHAHDAVCKTDFLKVRRFVEKPDASTARKYMRSGKFYWNSGMFVWSVAALEAAIRKHRPQLRGLIEKIGKSGARRRSDSFNAILKREYTKLEKISVDYAVMEKAGNIVMARCDFAWDDVGSWAALENHCEKDSGGNVVVGSGEIYDARDNIAVAEDGLIALVGVRDLVVVRSGAATLVCAKNKAQEIKHLVARMKKIGKYKGIV